LRSTAAVSASSAGSDSIIKSGKASSIASAGAAFDAVSKSPCK
jgi:hypothetical protein